MCVCVYVLYLCVSGGGYLGSGSHYNVCMLDWQNPGHAALSPTDMARMCALSDILKWSQCFFGHEQNTWLCSFSWVGVFCCWLVTCHPGLSADCSGHGSLWAPLSVQQTTSHLHEHPTACPELEGEQRGRNITTHVNSYFLLHRCSHINVAISVISIKSNNFKMENPPSLPSMSACSQKMQGSGYLSGPPSPSPPFCPLCSSSQRLWGMPVSSWIWRLLQITNIKAAILWLNKNTFPTWTLCRHNRFFIWLDTNSFDLQYTMSLHPSPCTPGLGG